MFPWVDCWRSTIEKIHSRCCYCRLAVMIRKVQRKQPKICIFNGINTKYHSNILIKKTFSIEIYLLEIREIGIDVFVWRKT